MTETTEMKKILAMAEKEQTDASHEMIVSSTKGKDLQEEEEAPPPKKKMKISLCDDLLQEIFVRLPVKSLCRFQCLLKSKSLNPIVSSNYFIDLHMARANTMPNKFLYLKPNSKQVKLYSCIPGLAPQLILTVENMNVYGLRLLSKPCRGLNLIYGSRVSSSSSSIYLCNPVTCELVELPKGNECAFFQSVGLGFHHRMKEYKVVRLFGYKILENSKSCEVYTLGKSYGWRPVGQIQYDITSHPPVFLHDCVHWIIKSKWRAPGSRGILSFNIVNESFGLMSLPPFSLDVDFHFEPHIGELDGCLFFSNYMRTEKTLEIWLMKDHEKSDWSRFCCLDLRKSPEFSAEISTVVPLPINARKIILLNGERAAVYDPISENITQDYFEIPERDHSGYWYFWCGLCEESLISVGKTHQEMLVSEEKNLILMRILSKLPLASICRFKSACKTWQTLISSNQFIDLHLECTRKTKGSKIFLVLGSLFEDSSLIPLESIDLISAKVKLKPIPFVSSKPCHGLNLLASSCGNNFLFNPFLMERYHLPSDLPDELITDVGHRMNHAACGQRIGLGYNAHKREHVVVKICYEIRRFHKESSIVSCIVWTSGASDWRRISEPPFPVSVMPPAFVDGSLYWMNNACGILAFDVMEEKFRVVDTPCIGSSGCRSTRQNTKAVFLVELGGYLAMVVADELDDVMEIWMMKHGRWTREHEIAFRNIPNYSLKERLVTPIDIRNDGMILFNTGVRLGYYDPVNKSMQTLLSLKHHQFGKFGSVFPVLSHESLVSPNSRSFKAAWS